jgi:hypothetical protein
MFAILISFPEKFSVMFGDDRISDKSSENNSSPLKNDIFDIPCNIALDIVDVVRDFDSA